jgi:hypothetical protein
MQAGRWYEALTLIEGCLVTKPMDVWPGLGVWPVDDARHRLGIATVMDDILARNDWGVRVGTSEWLTRESRNLPLALVQHTLPASTSIEAILYAASWSTPSSPPSYCERERRRRHWSPS